MKSPSKFLSREFLRRLTENNFINESRREYVASEVQADLIEKESRLAPIEAKREMQSYFLDLERELQGQGQEPPSISDTSREHQGSSNNDDNGGKMKKEKKKKRQWTGSVEKQLKVGIKTHEVTEKEMMMLLDEECLWASEEKERVSATI